jgi:hypothetical protein
MGEGRLPDSVETVVVGAGQAGLVPGLTFLGLPWLHDQASATFLGRAATRPISPTAGDRADPRTRS